MSALMFVNYRLELPPAEAIADPDGAARRQGFQSFLLRPFEQALRDRPLDASDDIHQSPAERRRFAPRDRMQRHGRIDERHERVRPVGHDGAAVRVGGIDIAFDEAMWN